MDEPRDLGLFPLGLVLLPGERVPLHIFEPRYRQLVADCTLEDRPFVLVLADEEDVARVGCAARFEELVRRFEDGRLNVIVAGVDPVEILEETSGHLYLSALVRSCEDLPEPADAALADEVRELFRTASEKITGSSREPVTADGVPLSYAVAGSLELDADVKQALLEERSEAERLARVRGILSVALEGMDRATVAALRAQSNGKVAHG
jgi:ATP-dependent Lon protease